MGIINNIILVSAFATQTVNNNMKFNDIANSILNEQVNVNVIKDIESTNNPHAVNPKSGASGIMQLLPKTWADATTALGKNWPFNPDVFDPQKSIIVGNHYLNSMIPQYLRASKLPDTVELRLAAYNWGIGNLKDAYQRYGNAWYDAAPEETKNYIKKYNDRIGRLGISADVVVRKPIVGAKANIYTVKPNDTLYSIARRLGTTDKELIRLNPTVKPTRLMPGQKLKY